MRRILGLCVLVLFFGGCKKMGAPGSADAGGAPGAGSAPAGEHTWRRSSLDAHAIRIEVGDEESLPLELVHVQARVDGFRARVVVDVDFRNTLPRTLEGTFQMRLPEGASPFFLAFGQHQWSAAPLRAQPPTVWEPEALLSSRGASWVEPREARMVERDLAFAAYTEVTQRRVDPALAEWTGAGVFHGRLFPLTGGERHRVVVGYDVDLVRVGDGWHLPLGLPDGEHRRVLDVDVATAGLEVELPGAEEDAGTQRTNFRAEDPAQESFELTVRGEAALAVRGSDGSTGDYFAARIRPELPAVEASGPRRAVFAVDVSMSSDPDRFNVWVDLVDAILSSNGDELQEFAVLFFNVETFWWEERFVPNTAAGRARLRSRMHELALEGATDLGAALQAAARPTWSPDAEFDLFLLSDGAATWGQPSREKIAADTAKGLQGRLFAYTTGIPGGEPQMLAMLARDTGGAVFSVGGAVEVAAASTAHRREPWALVRVEADGLQDILVDGAPRFVYPGQSLTVAGRVDGDDPSEVRLVVRRGEQTRTIPVALPWVGPSDAAPRVFGQIAVAQIESLPEAPELRAGNYARHFRVVGRTASLLMLEDSDYQRFGLDAAGQRHDAARVRTHRIGPALASVRRRVAKTLDDPKREFKALLARLRRAAGVGLVLSDGATRFIDAMPATAFEVAPGPLQCARHDVAVASRDYDEVFAKAAKRKRDFGAADGLKALSSLVEARPGDTVVARDVAFTAMEWGLGQHVTHLLRRVVEARPQEPLAYHALALNLQEQGNVNLATAYYEIALSGAWDFRFRDFRPVVAMDYLRMLRSTRASRFADPVFVQERMAGLRRELKVEEADLVVMISWNTDATDVDLHVVEPTGEECFYGNRQIRGGGELAADVTTGFGPEIYVARQAKKGSYVLTASYYAGNQNRTSARTRVLARVYRNFGTPKETVETKTVALERNAETHAIGVVTF